MECWYVPDEQFVQMYEPAAEYIPAAHGMHVVYTTAPVMAEYLPPEQMLHLAWPLFGA